VENTSMKILVADDSRVMRLIVIRTLRQAGMGGHGIVEAEDGAQALKLVTSVQPDLILSDWNMPNMSGIDFLLTLRSRGDQTPFCFVTSEGSPEMRQKADQGGALGLIAKPFTAEAFSDVLSTVVC
jgi:two-component system chemotaxis response regulator CheY